MLHVCIIMHFACVFKNLMCCHLSRPKKLLLSKKSANFNFHLHTLRQRCINSVTYLCIECQRLCVYRYASLPIISYKNRYIMCPTDQSKATRDSHFTTVWRRFRFLTHTKICLEHACALDMPFRQKT